MKRPELIRMLALNFITDDYESPDHIREQLKDLAQECELRLEQYDVQHALMALVQRGWANAFVLSTTAPAFKMDSVPSIDRITEYYYLISPAGRDALESFNGWPFDESGAFITGWQAPVD